MWSVLFRTLLATGLATKHEMDSLKADLRSIQGVAKDLLNHLGGDLSVPSWKFPEKLASHLDTDLVLRERERDEEGLGDNKLFIMELIADR